MPKRQGIGTPTLPVGALADLPRLMSAMGHDPWPFLAGFRIDRDAFAERGTPLPLTLYGRILEAASRTTGCAHFGLLLGEAAALENVGELRFLALNASTARQAVDHLARFARLMHQPLRLKIGHEQGYTSIAIALVEDVPGADHILVCYTASSVKALRTIIGARWNPSIVHLALRRPKVIEPYRHCFRSTVLFDQPAYAILFPEANLDTPRAGGDPRLSEFIFQRLCALEAQTPPDLVGQVRHAIETQLLRGECDAVHTAGIFSIHRKTLHGYLRELGTSFEALRDETREALAVRMLEHTDLPLAEISAALRFSSQAVLTRAFRRWHGQSPSEWRKGVAGRLGLTRAASRYKAETPGRR